MPKLENWSFHKMISDRGVTYKVEGNVYESQRYKDGTFITTNTVKSVDFSTNTAVVKENEVYQLGEMSWNYRQWLDKNEIILEEYIKI